MKKTEDIIFELEGQILPRLNQIKILQNEVDTLQKTVSSLRGLGENTPITKTNDQENTLANYPGYPMQGTLIEKYNYLEDQTLKVWTKEQMEGLIATIEGKHAKKTLKSARQKTHYYISKHELIKLKYSNKNGFTFFTTRSEWVEREDNDGKLTFRLLPQHEPDAALLSGLTEEQRKPENINWSGIN